MPLQFDTRTQFTHENILGDPDLTKELTDPIENNFQISQAHNGFNKSANTQTYRKKEKVKNTPERRIKRNIDAFLNESREFETLTENYSRKNETNDTTELIRTNNEENRHPNDQEDAFSLQKFSLYDLLKTDRSKKLTKINKHDKFYPEQKQKIFFKNYLKLRQILNKNELPAQVVYCEDKSFKKDKKLILYDLLKNNRSKNLNKIIKHHQFSSEPKQPFPSYFENTLKARQTSLPDHMKFSTTEETSMDKRIDIGHEIINYKSIQNFFFVDEMF